MNARLKYEIIDVASTEVEVDVSLLKKADEMFFNATAIAKQFDKRPGDWLRLDDTKTYIDILSRRENLHFQNIILVKKGGKHQGSWFHQKLAIRFARWLSVAFEYDLDRWIEARIAHEQSWKQARLAAKTGYLALSEAVSQAHDDPKFYHYANEANMVNKIILGMSAKDYRAHHGVAEVRDACDLSMVQALDELQAMNGLLIKMGKSYGERRDALTEYYQGSEAL